MDSYDKWLQDPTPANMGAILGELDPVITAEVSRYSGGPVIKTKARVLTVNAVRNFDPAKGAKLKSWVVTQLQPLSRYRQNLTPLRVPEAAARKAADLNRMQSELAETLGHNPTDVELADKVGISVKRINQLRDMSRAVATESAVAGISDTDEPSSLPAVTTMGTGMSFAASEAYKGLDPRSQFIYDASIGANGRKQLSKQEIAAKLGVTPAFVSQQSASIAEQIQRAQAALGD
jgi:DNA-directed RNA polymerase specialized sigma subunit